LKRASSSSPAKNNEEEVEDKNLLVPAGFACLDAAGFVSAENISFKSDFSTGDDETCTVASDGDDENNADASIGLWSCLGDGAALDLGSGLGDAALGSGFGDSGFGAGSVFAGASVFTVGRGLASGFGDAAFGRGLASGFGDAAFGAGSVFVFSGACTSAFFVGASVLLSLLDLDLAGGSGFWRGDSEAAVGAEKETRAGVEVAAGSGASSSSSSFGSEALDSAHK